MNAGSRLLPVERVAAVAHVFEFVEQLLASDAVAVHTVESAGVDDRFDAVSVVVRDDRLPGRARVDRPTFADVCAGLDRTLSHFCVEIHPLSVLLNKELRALARLVGELVDFLFDHLIRGHPPLYLAPDREKLETERVHVAVVNHVAVLLESREVSVDRARC